MSNNLKILIGFGAAVVVLAGVYIWFSASESGEFSVVETNTITNTDNALPGDAGSGGQVDKGSVLREGRKILRTLDMLRGASIDSSFFTSGTSSLKMFEDYSVKIPEAEKGRDNPFAIQ